MATHPRSIQPTTPFHPSTSCPTCSKIAQEVRDWAGFVQQNRSVSIAPWARFLNEHGCSTCKKVVAYFESYASKKAPKPQCIMRVACDRGGDLSLSCEDEGCLEKYCIEGWCSMFCSTSKSEEEKVCLETVIFCWSTVASALHHSEFALSLLLTESHFLFCSFYVSPIIMALCTYFPLEPGRQYTKRVSISSNSDSGSQIAIHSIMGSAASCPRR